MSSVLKLWEVFSGSQSIALVRADTKTEAIRRARSEVRGSPYPSKGLTVRFKGYYDGPDSRTPGRKIGNPAKTQKRLRNFTGTVTRLANGSVVVKGVQR
jgi:hypothetical protein